MWIRHLSLTNFRNYRRQELDLAQGPVLLLGDNAQGKSNLLEAIFLLATTRSERAPASKRLRVTGVPRRQVDVVGQLMAVLFSTDDLALIGGPPAERRRFLDVTLSQLDQAYYRALQRYGRVVTQRNALLRRIQEGHAAPEELAFWDEQLSQDGAVLMGQRAAEVAVLAERGRG